MGDGRGPASHEAICILNAGNLVARIRVTIYFADREPAGPYQLEVQPRRTKRIRFDGLTDPEPIPAATGFSSVIESSVPIVVQPARPDPQQPTLSTTAFPLA